MSTQIRQRHREVHTVEERSEVLVRVHYTVCVSPHTVSDINLSAIIQYQREVYCTNTINVSYVVKAVVVRTALFYYGDGSNVIHWR